MIFDLNVRLPDVLYEHVIEVDERVVLHRQDCKMKHLLKFPTVTTKTNEQVGTGLKN